MMAADIYSKAGADAKFVTKDEAVSVNDATMTAVAGDPGSAFSAQQLATFVTPSTVDDIVAVKVSETRVIKPVALSSDPDGLREYPKLRKLDANGDGGVTPMIPLSAQSASSLYWPYLINLAQAGGTGYGLLYSTDHDAGQGGIYMMTAPSPFGPWTDKGRIFRDTGSGWSQTETPSALWNAAEGVWYIYYQAIATAAADPRGVGNQYTKLVTTPDFVTFTNRGIVLDKVPYTYGDGNVTYFRPFTYGGSHYGYLLYGGTTNGGQTIAYSKDLLSWQPDPRLVTRSPQILTHLIGFDPATFRLKFNGAIVLEWRGNPWVIMSAGTSGAGGGARAINRIIAARLSSDFRRILTRPVDITPTPQSWEGATEDVSTGAGASVVTFEGRVYCLFRGVSEQSGFGLMEVY